MGTLMGSSGTSVSSVKSPCLNAARYTNGFIADPGCRSERLTRLKSLYVVARPFTSLERLGSNTLAVAIALLLTGFLVGEAVSAAALSPSIQTVEVHSHVPVAENVTLQVLSASTTVEVTATILMRASTALCAPSMVREIDG